MKHQPCWQDFSQQKLLGCGYVPSPKSRKPRDTSYMYVCRLHVIHSTHLIRLPLLGRTQTRNHGLPIPDLAYVRYLLAQLCYLVLTKYNKTKAVNSLRDTRSGDSNYCLLINLCNPKKACTITISIEDPYLSIGRYGIITTTPCISGYLYHAGMSRRKRNQRPSPSDVSRTKLKGWSMQQNRICQPITSPCSSIGL